MKTPKPIAIRATLIGKSDTNPEYLKFKIELSTGEILPAYGKDLQDALRRVKKDLTIQSLKKDIRQLYGIVVVILCIALIVFIANIVV